MKVKSKPLKEKSKNLLDNICGKAWKNVQIEGRVISDDGSCGLEGLIGLEVLENYDNSLVMKSKKVKRKKVLDKKGKLSNKADSDKDDNDDQNAIPKKKKKKKTKQIKSDKNGIGKTDSMAGRFVLLNPNSDSSPSANVEGIGNDENAIMSSTDLDGLIGWNGMGVPDVILKAIAENGFTTPTQIQSLTLPPAILGKKDILGAAETGSGKTLAFGIPILAGILELKKKNILSGIRKPPKITNTDKESSICRENLTPPPEESNAFEETDNFERNESSSDEDDDNSNKPLYALILTPTRELAVQIKDHLVNVAKYTDIQITAIFGGLAAVKQERVLKRCPEIVVATPGRLWELLQQGNKHLNKLDDISFLVIDETDRMVEKGHFEELELLMRRLNSDQSKKETRQNFVFSATLTMVHDIPDHLKKKNFGRRRKLVKTTPGIKLQMIIDGFGISQPKVVDITRSTQTVESLTECRIICPIDHKDYYLYYFIQKHPGRTIVFCNSIDCVKRLAQLFNILNCQALPLHANMIQKQRLKNLEKFRDSPCGLLIATDVAARGLDIKNVQHVIHYQVPRTSENYVHRSGRTARANKDGITVILMEPGEIKSYLNLCKTLDRAQDLPLFPIMEKYLKAVMERVNLAREVDLLDLKMRRSQNQIGWLKKTAEEMDIVLDDDNEDDDEHGANIEFSKSKRLLATRRQQLLAILSKPLFPRGFSFKYPTSSGNLESPFLNATPCEDNSAVKAMKDSIEECKQIKKNHNKKRRKLS